MKWKRIIFTTLIMITITACSNNISSDTIPTSESSPIVNPTIVAPTQENSSSVPSPLVSYSKDIVPLMFAHCTSCHGTDRVSRNLDLRTYVTTMKGSQNGAVVIPGDSDASLLTKQIIDGKMPKRGPKLSEEEKNLFIQWVIQGAINN